MKNLKKERKKDKQLEEENPNDVANKILEQHLAGKSFGFIKSVLYYIDTKLEIICTAPND